MTWQPMKGVKVVEVAQFTFTPSAGAVLADWGADVIKVEHAVTGDAQRSLVIGAGGAAAGSFQPLMEHPNRGKRSIGLSLHVPSGHDVLMELVRDADVFLTNFLPSARRRLHIELEDIRAANPNIIYVRGSGHGQRGPEAERPGLRRFDVLVAHGLRVGHDAARQPAAHRPALRRVRRLDGRGDDGRRRRGRAVLTREDRRAVGRRRVAHGCRRVGDGALARHRDGLGRGALARAARRAAVHPGEPDGRVVPHRRTGASSR